MKYLIGLVLCCCVGCSSIANPQRAAQSVKVLDSKLQLMKTTCNGAVDTWVDCIDRAKLSCKGGYDVIDKLETPVGARRELTFQCKK